MAVVSTREFRDKQKNYLGKIDGGIEILIQKTKNKSREREDDTRMSKEEYHAMLDEAFQNIREGKTKRYTMEELRKKMGL
jgi:hypothetical protein